MPTPPPARPPSRPPRRWRALAVFLPLVAALASRGAEAQPRTASAGDALLRAGRVEAAEGAYYRAAARRPRDPAVRLALGRYLASRGALRVGAVLLEEARFFGGDTAAVARELAPVYARLNDHAALAALPRSPLSAPERERAAWLRDHPPSVVGEDSVVVPFTPAARGGSAIGSFRATVSGRPVTVVVDGALSGWVLDPALGRGRGTRLFGGQAVAPGRTVGIADVRLGGLSLVQVPVRFATAAAAAAGGEAPLARVGLDVLGAFAPTFDARAGRLVLRGDGRVRRARRAEPMAAVLSSDGVYLSTGEALVSLAAPRGRELLAPARRWTFDRRRGEIVLER